eukprot:SAG31_NODE_11540_length_1019_cov_1.177174_1_plen_217_part_01
MHQVNLFGGQHYAVADVDQAELDVDLDRLLIILSDIHLDQPSTQEKLRTMLEGYSMMEPPPSCFVFLGNFFSQSVGCSGLDVQSASQLLSDLGAMISEFDELVQASEFLFVPGPDDPGPAPGLLPRPPLPNVFTRGLREHLPQIHLGSNPCRVNYCGQHFVFFRDNIMHKLRRNLVLPVELDPPVRSHTVAHSCAVLPLAVAIFCFKFLLGRATETL